MYVEQKCPFQKTKKFRRGIPQRIFFGARALFIPLKAGSFANIDKGAEL